MLKILQTKYTTLTAVIYNIKFKIFIFALSQEMHPGRRHLSPPFCYGPVYTCFCNYLYIILTTTNMDPYIIAYNCYRNKNIISYRTNLVTSVYTVWLLLKVTNNLIILSSDIGLIYGFREEIRNAQIYNFWWFSNV
jgi:hypothetical protein